MKISIIVLGALGVSFMLRQSSAAVRHWVLAAAVVCAAAIPFLEVVVPVWRVPIAAPASFEPYSPAVQHSVTDAVVRNPESGIRTSPLGGPLGSTSVPPFDWGQLLRRTWIIGSLTGLAVLLVGLLRLAWLAGHARRVTGGYWSKLAHELSHAYGLSRPVVILQSEHPSLLVTWGLARPKVILPADAPYWPEARARVVLTHELAHIHRGDWIVQMWAELLRALYWFNPLLWIACQKLRLESEHACDDEVMNRGLGGVDYARHLVELARALNQRRDIWFPAPAMARPSSLERRVRAMLNDRLSRTPITGTTRLIIFAAVFVATLAIAAAQSGFVSFTGSVLDEQSRGIPGAVVSLANEQRHTKYEVTSNDAGRFELVGLPAGEYRLEVRGIGFQGLKDVLKVGGQNVQRNFMMKLGTLQETVTVGFNPADAADSSASPTVKEVPMPAPKECSPSSTGGRIVPPRKIRDVYPVYPASLRGTGTEGAVVMEGRIGIDGYVGDIRLVGDAHPDLAQSATAAVREWRFTQTLLNCEPVEVTMTITTNFQATPPPPPPPPRP